MLRDEDTGAIIYFDSYEEAKSEAERLTQAAYGNPRLVGMDFTPVKALDELHS